MASISTDQKTGVRRIMFYDAAGERKVFRIGTMSMRLAETLKSHVRHIVNAQVAGEAAPLSTARWLADLAEKDSRLLTKLAKVGLVTVTNTEEAEASPLATLGPFVDNYISQRQKSVRKSTINSYKQTRKSLGDYFGDDKPLGDITVADANAWRRWMLTTKLDAKPGRAAAKGLADNTARRRCGFARQFFNEAIDSRLIAENPFHKMKGIGVRANRSRDYFLSREDAEKLLQACPDNEWKLLFALSRFGGLRCPSEHLALTWGDVNWEQGKLTVHVPKLEHLGEEFATRVIPIFPELRPYLEAAWDEAGEGDTFIIKRYRSANCNLRTQLERYIKLAGLKPWPKLFHNLRATRQTELAKSHPAHVVCAWIGNSQAVAQKHYLQVTDDDFKDAQKTAPNPARASHERGCTEGAGVTAESKNAEKFAISAVLENVQCSLMDSNHEPTD